MHSDNPIVPYISLCSGYEGIGLGIHRCIPNLRAVAYCEREAFAIANLVAKMEEGLLDAAPVFTDVTNFPWADYAPYMAEGILSFGWPCQPVSTAGKRKSTEDERWLFDIIADGISVLRPGMLFAENVEGLLSAKMPDGSSVFGHCIERLESLHYKVAAGIFSASEVGAPHQRKRVFILAHCNSKRGQLSDWWRLATEQMSVSDGKAWGNELGDTKHNGLHGTKVARGNETDAGTWASEEQEMVKQCQGAGCMGGTLFPSRPGELADTQLHGCDHSNERSHPDAIEGPLGQGHEHRQAVGNGQLWPSRPGEPQHGWEPPRVVGNAELQRLAGCAGTGHGKSEIVTKRCEEGSRLRQTQPTLGRDSDGLADRMDYAQLCVSCDNRTDELRLLGNGVVPATAERAFLTLMEELTRQ